MTSCIFCKIIRGEIPAFKVYEDENILAFLDIQPVNPGHTLLVPKEHFADLLEIPADLTAKLFFTAKKVARAAITATGAAGFNIGVNTGSVAGQVIFHTHVHIMPRFSGDELHPWPKKVIDKEKMETVAAAIRRAL